MKIIYRTSAHKFRECFKLIRNITKAVTCKKMKVSLRSCMLGDGIPVQAMEVCNALVHANSSNQNKKVRATRKLNFIRLRLIH